MNKHSLPGAKIGKLIQLLTVVLMLWTGSIIARAQTSSFTFQGSLSESGSPANGIYDLQFKLFDALSSGAQQGATILRDDVQVTNGVFSVTLDFGSSAFSGAGRFLEISVRPGASGGAFTLLSPRQEITSTPYAIKSLMATTADSLSSACINCVTSNQIGGLPSGNANYIQNTSSQQSNASFNISGNGTAAGTFSADTMNAATQFNLGGVRVLSANGAQNFFAGSGAGQSNSSGSSNAFFGFNAGASNSSGSSNAFFGRNAGSTNSSGGSNSFFGFNAGGVNTNGSNNSFFGLSAGSNNSTGSNNTVIGAGANLSAGTLNFATAIGAGAIVSTNNTVVLGRNLDAVNIPGALTVAGMISSSSGGFKFPDGTTQTTSGLSSVSVNNMFDGNGTGASPLAIHTPLTLSTSVSNSGAVEGLNLNANPLPTASGIYGQGNGGIGVRGLHAATTGTAAGVQGESNSTDSSAVGTLGIIVSTTPGSTSAGVRGINNGTGGLGVGVYGSHAGGGWGVYGVAPNGRGVYGSSSGGIGVYGNSSTSNGIYASSNGQARNAASLRANNTNSNGGMAAYLTNNSNFATAHFANANTGEVLYLQANGGPFIKAVNNDESEAVFTVNYNGTTVTKVLQITGGADLAEQFEINESPVSVGDKTGVQPSAGLIVSIDPDEPGKLVVSNQAYDRKVAGIISGAGGVKTGMIMSQAGSIADGAQPVALTGRVYCWADASSGSIEPGDLLTTSTVPGHAMKINDYAKAHGAIVGKAMTSLKSGRGLVLVLVTLQ
ncbi:MAG: beta strand repeat-containing protein [Blastocatellales bacterium]